jgi:glycerol uptake facilitator-like aquaporin/catechol 2,3-dioxygenase-like lactoylglutathione lyase family enzyme
MTRTPRHWREYAMEGCCLGIFMISAVAFAIVLQHPRSPLAGWTTLPPLARAPMGVAMGLTNVALIYSPAGRRSGAHMNPAVTLTFFRLGKISAIDAGAYISAQFLGGAAGMCIASLVFRRFAADASVNYVATMPGLKGAAWAFSAETAISFVMMLTVLVMSNAQRLARLTGIAAGVLVATFITFEAPFSGMSMNPARTVASALAYARLRQHGVTHASSGPQRLPDWNVNAGGIRAFYFRDPDGHFLEVLQFPPGKGDAKWHASDRLFLGIDHTAIVVSDTDRSLGLYRELLGMRVAGTSENYDIEQEHLNNVFGARLRITTLRAAAGPGIELLEYLAPRDGRPAPIDLKANDLAHWQTTLIAPGAGALFDLASSRPPFALVSPRLATPDPSIGAAGLIRDPDGHGLRLVVKRAGD